MRGARVRRGAVLAGLMLVTVACRTWQVESVTPRELLRDPKVEAVRVTRTDKSKVEIYDPVLQGDSIVGHPTDRAIARIVMPLSEVEQIATKQKSLGRTLLIGLGIVGAVTLYALLQELNQTGY